MLHHLQAMQNWSKKIVSLEWVRIERKKRAFIENGSMVLEKLIAFCNGKSIPIRSFSDEELKQATNNYDARLVIVHN